jgi:hypothetical protein
MWWWKELQGRDSFIRHRIRTGPGTHKAYTFAFDSEGLADGLIERPVSAMRRCCFSSLSLTSSTNATNESTHNPRRDRWVNCSTAAANACSDSQLSWVLGLSWVRRPLPVDSLRNGPLEPRWCPRKSLRLGHCRTSAACPSNRRAEICGPLGGCPLVSNCGLELAVKYYTGRRSIERRWFHPERADPCVPVASASLSSFHCRQL